MIITIASGKGGTGKTTFAVNLAYALSNQGIRARLLDCDVEEPNDYLFVKPEFTETTPVTAMKPVLNEAKCTACGKCADACKYNAIAVVRNKVLIFDELCHSCGVCSYVCPENALSEKPQPIGEIQSADKGPFFFAHGLLNIGEALAPNVVRSVKSYIDPEVVNIIDASPGTACPVVEATEGADVAVLVTEPTPFGLNDLKLAVGLTLKLGVPTGILINRSDGKDDIIAEYANQVGIPVIGRIPFKREYAEIYSNGDILAAVYSEFNNNMLTIYERIRSLQGTNVPPVPVEKVFPVNKKSVQPFPSGDAAGFREITVISGKGGTGKTTVTAAFAQLAESKVLADNDVDAADLHLLLRPTIRESHEFSGGMSAKIDAEKCTACGLCAEACHFNAIRFDGQANSSYDKTYRIDEFSCEGCGLCPLVCPFQAISSETVVNGHWYVSITDFGPMVHARLGIAEENSGKLVTTVRNHAAKLARNLKLKNILADGPPGTGCPVIASVTGTDLVLIITEPTVSGVHDLERVLKLTNHFSVPAYVIINKSDLNEKQALRIETMAKEYNSQVVARIPFDRFVNEALMAGKTVIEYGKGPAFEAIKSSWDILKKNL
ncbi:P-loop NTPase [candidate division KSB1 bacterium]|nr:P-loop NTPase [candidate division KSB1 bacterium]